MSFSKRRFFLGHSVVKKFKAEASAHGRIGFSGAECDVWNY